MADQSKPGRVVFTQTLASDRGTFRGGRAYDLPPADAARYVAEGNARPAAAGEAPVTTAAATSPTPTPTVTTKRPR